MRTSIAVLSAAVLAACSSPRAPGAAATSRASRPASAPSGPGIDPAIVDRTADPCSDFYQYACGGWIARTEIPEDQPAWYRSFHVMREENKARLRSVLEPAAAGEVDPEDRYGRLVGDFYAACMDEAAIERNGLDELRRAWAALDSVRDPRSLAAALGRLHAQAVFPVFAVFSGQDAKDSTQVIGRIWQGGLTLPDRDYYTKQDEKSVAVREDLVAFSRRAFALAGVPAEQAAADAATVLRIETALARTYWTRVEARDPDRTYNRLDLVGLKKAAPRFDWDGYLAALGAQGVTAFAASTPKALEQLDALVAEEPPAAWRAYLRWHLLTEAAEARALPRAIADEAFWFRARNFTGEKALPERWKRCVELTDGLLGEALGQAFVRRFFGGDAKEKALALVEGIQGAMGRRIATLPWMDDATRAKALEKLGAMDDKIGYPDVWRSYDGLEVRRESFFGSLSSARAFEVSRQLAKIGKPVDRHEWLMSPPAVNAYYSPARNEIVFPAGILQPPFYTQGANEAVNYGAIGMVVGHELTHGFDDQGRKYDAKGNLTDWWSASVSREFERRAECVVKQYADYPFVDDVKHDGKLTLGENIADLGGLKLAFAAYQASRKGRPPEAPVGGFDAEQQFFLAHAQAWCSKIRPENARLRALTGPHSSARWRVNGPLSNLPEFARAFSCPASSPMVRAERCEVW